MSARFLGPWKRLNLSQQFMLASLVILLAGMAGLGTWVGAQIADGVVHRTGATTALYVESFVAPEIRGLAQWQPLTEQQTAALTHLLKDTPLGRQIVAFKVWGRGGRVLYSTEPGLTGQVFPVQGGLAQAWKGEVASRISGLEDAENAAERLNFSHLLETYTPIRQEGDNQIMAVAEFYQAADELDREIAGAQGRSWLAVALATLATYLLLTGIVRRGSDTIRLQQAELRDKVARLTALLDQNEELHDRVRRAARRTTELNEQFLRRVSSELHDGPAQDLSLSLLRLDSLRSGIHAQVGLPARRANGRSQDDLEAIQASLERALQDLRSISTGLRLPELEKLTVAETVGRAVRAHERRTGSRVDLNLGVLPDHAPLPVKFTLYRLIQEALSNAYRHGRGVDQRVRVEYDGIELHAEVSDRGPGFDRQATPPGGQHLGLTTMRERVESLGGVFSVEASPGNGARVDASLPVQGVEIS